MAKDLVVSCPSCGTSVTWSARQRWRPFCSERCRLIDLGAWADESHAIPVQPDTTGDFLDEELSADDRFSGPITN